MKYKLIIIIFILMLNGCGKVGPLALPKEKLDKTVISYPCDKECEKNFENEKQRQKSIILQTD